MKIPFDRYTKYLIVTFTEGLVITDSSATSDVMFNSVIDLGTELRPIPLIRVIIISLTSSFIQGNIPGITREKELTDKSGNNKVK